jgi:hypothetical protein
VIAEEWKRRWRVAVSEQTQRLVVRGRAAASERDMIRMRRREGGMSERRDGTRGKEE